MQDIFPFVAIGKQLSVLQSVIGSQTEIENLKFHKKNHLLKQERLEKPKPKLKPKSN